jgi:hypothetical protein
LAVITNKVPHDLTWNRYLVETFDLGPHWNSWVFSKTSTVGELKVAGGSGPRHTSGPKVGLPNTAKLDKRGSYTINLDQYEAWAIATALKDGVIKNKKQEIPREYKLSLVGNYERRFDESSVIRLSDLVEKSKDGVIRNLDDFDALTPRFGLETVTEAINRAIATRLTFSNATGMLSDSSKRSWPCNGLKNCTENKPWKPLTDAFLVLNAGFSGPLIEECQKLHFERFQRAQQPMEPAGTPETKSATKSRRRPS